MAYPGYLPVAGVFIEPQSFAGRPCSACLVKTTHQRARIVDPPDPLEVWRYNLQTAGAFVARGVVGTYTSKGVITQPFNH